MSLYLTESNFRDVDKAGIQFLTLNMSRGAAVWARRFLLVLVPLFSDAFDHKQGPRAQVDRKLYKRHMQEILFNYPNLQIRAASVHDLVFQHDDATHGTWGTVKGVRLGKFNSLPPSC